MFAWFAKFKIWAKATEKDVLTIIVAAKQGLDVAEAELKKGWAWLYDHTDEIAAAVSTVAEVVSSLKGAGVKIPPSVVKSVAEANKAVAALNAMMEETGDSPKAQDLIDGYVAAKNVWTAADKANVAVAMAPQVNVQ